MRTHIVSLLLLALTMIAAGCAQKVSGDAEPESLERPSYTEEEVRFQVGDITLAGTLTVPRIAGPHPAVVLISGSAADNRDAQVDEFKPFYILADHLTRQGLAVLRYDDRGVGESTGEHTWQYTIEDFAHDVQSAVGFLQTRKDIDGQRIGLVGHSLGGVVGPLAASRSVDVAFVVTLAGYGLLGEEVVAQGQRSIARDAGKTEEEMDEIMRWVARFNQVARKGRGLEELTTAARARALADFEALPAQERERYSTFDAYFETTYDSVMLQFVPTPFYRHVLDYDPLPALEKVTCPVLLLFAENDMQVSPDLNSKLMVAALEKAGNRDVTVKVIPNATHYFRDWSVSGETFAPGFLEAVSTWILARLEVVK